MSRQLNENIHLALFDDQLSSVDPLSALLPDTFYESLYN
jgi:hypothetical protein